MNILFAILNLVCVAMVAVWHWRGQKSSIRKFYWPALVLKLIAGLMVGLIYQRYYAYSDTVVFFQYASTFSQLARSDFGEYLSVLFTLPEGEFLGENRTLFFIKVTSVFALIGNGNYWITSLYFSLLSFFSAWHLTTWVTRLSPSVAIPAVIAFLLFPSCVFWSSGILKESLAMAGLYYIAAMIVKIWLKDRLTIYNYLLLVVAIGTLWMLKYHYAGIFIPAAFSALLVMRISQKIQMNSFLKQVVLFFAICAIVLFTTGFLHPNLRLNRVLSVILENHQLFIATSDPGDVIHFYQLKPEWGSVLINSPLALVSGLFAPIIPNLSNIFQMTAVLENFVLIALTLLSLHGLRQMPNSPHRLLVLAMLFYIVMLSVFLGLSTPNFGTLVRYRVGFMPFLVLLISNQTFLVKSLSRFLTHHTLPG